MTPLSVDELVCEVDARMRSTLALIAGGAAAGASIPILRLLDFGPTELKILPFIAGLIVWSAVKSGGAKS